MSCVEISQQFDSSLDNDCNKKYNNNLFCLICKDSFLEDKQCIKGKIVIDEVKELAI